MFRKRRNKHDKEATEASSDASELQQFEVLMGQGMSRFIEIRQIGSVESCYRCIERDSSTCSNRDGETCLLHVDHQASLLSEPYPYLPV